MTTIDTSTKPPRSPRARLVLFLLAAGVLIGVGLIIGGTVKQDSDSDEHITCVERVGNEQYFDSVSDMSSSYMADHQEEMVALHAAYMGRVYSGEQPVFGCSLNDAGKYLRWLGIGAAVIAAIGLAIALAPGTRSQPEGPPSAT